jgi:hypothetical protein
MPLGSGNDRDGRKKRVRILALNPPSRSACEGGLFSPSPPSHERSAGSSPASRVRRAGPAGKSPASFSQHLPSRSGGMLVEGRDEGEAERLPIILKI